MRAKVLTLRFSPQLGRIDDTALIALQQKVVLEHVREHLIHVGDEVMLVCVATWREREPATQAPTTTHSAETSTAADSPPEPSRAPATPVADLLEDLTPEQQAMFELVRAWRRQKAHAEGVPPYVVLTNRQLVDVVRQRPQTKTGLTEIHGLGDKKVARHGQELLAILWPELPPNNDRAPSEQHQIPAEATS